MTRGLVRVVLCLIWAGVLGVLGGWAARPGADVLRPVAATTPTELVRVLVATTRQPAADDPYAFTAKRAHHLSYVAYTLSLPPTHVLGNIEWPAQAPGDPARDMVVTATRPLDRAAFTRAAAAGSGGDVMVFVHGYNTSQQEAVYRVGQFAADSGVPGNVVAFTWPSFAKLTDYVADRESTNYSRDYLERVLNELAATPGIRRISVVAHSMGSWLAMETLRQARMRGAPFVRKLDQFVLLSPDIDVDVFRSQLDAIGTLPHPITVLTSADDRALKISQDLGGGVPRVGNVTIDAAQAQEIARRYNLSVVDLSRVADDDPLRHNKFIKLLPALHQSVGQEARARELHLIQRAGVFFADTAGRILAPDR